MLHLIWTYLPKTRAEQGHWMGRVLLVALICCLTACGTNMRIEMAPTPHASKAVTPTLNPGAQDPTIFVFTGHSYRPVVALAWSSDSKRLLSADIDGRVEIWDATTGDHVLQFAGYDGVGSVAWSPDDSRIAYAGDNAVDIYDVYTGQEVLSYRQLHVQTVAWSPNGKQLASGSLIGTVQVQDAKSGKNIVTYHGHTESVNAVAWSPDSRLVASASNDNTVQVWEASTGKRLFTYREQTSSVDTVAWSPDGKSIASGGLDNTLRIWSMAKTAHRFLSFGQNGSIEGLAWSPNSKYIASANGEDTVRIFNAETGSLVETYSRSGEGFHTVAWSPDGKYLASTSNSVQVWFALLNSN